MRILSVGINLSRGGTERALQNFSMSYRRLGHEVAVFAWRDGGPRQEKLQREGIDVIVGGSALEQGLRAAEDFSPDVIHIHRVGFANPTESAILRRLRTPRRRVLETNVFGRVDESDGADHIDVHMHLGAWCLWRWRRWAGRRGRERIGIVVPNPVMPEHFARADRADVQAFRAKLGIPSDAFVCGRIGQSNHDKLAPGHLEGVLPDRGAGSRGAAAAARLTGLAAPDAVEPVSGYRAPGHRAAADGRRRRALARVLVARLLSSRGAVGESFGYVLTEAMLCECPVVTASTPHDSNTQVEVVEHLVGGIVAGSLTQLPEAVAFLWSHRELAAQLKPHLRQHVLSRFDSDIVARQVLTVAELALDSPDRRDAPRTHRAQ